MTLNIKIKKTVLSSSPKPNVHLAIQQHSGVSTLLSQGYVQESVNEYTDQNGNTSFYKVRLKNPHTKEKWIRPVHFADGKWIWEEPTFDGLKPLYSLPTIVSNPEARVWVLEGEFKVDQLNQFFHKLGVHVANIATTSGSSSSAGKADWKPLSGMQVSIWPDNDVPGGNYAIQVAHHLKALSCLVEVVNVPLLNLPYKGDVVDWLAQHPESSIADLNDLPMVTHPKEIDEAEQEPIYGEDLVDRLNRSHAVVSINGQALILTEFINEKNQPDITLGRASDLKLLYAHDRVVTTDLLGRKHDVCVFNAWMEASDRRTYRGIVFAPQGAPSDFYNLFRGFSVEPIEGDCTLYLQHLRDNICRGHDGYYEYLLNWMAHMIQRPGELPGTAIVFRGPQGVGKGVATDELGRLVEPHYTPLSSIEQLVGRFTGHLKDKLLVYANEATWGGNKAGEGALKAMITDPDSSVEEKFKNVVRIDNFKRVMASSNEDWAVPLGKDDRRFFVLDVGSEHKEDHAYFAAIIDQMRNGGSEALMYELQNRDLSEFNVRKIPPTPYNFELKLLSMESSDQFVYEYLRASTKDGWEIYVQKSHLHSNYLDWCSDHGKKHKHTASIFGKHLIRLIPSTSDCKMVESHTSNQKKRHMYYVFQNLDTCRKEFEKVCKASPAIWEL